MNTKTLERKPVVVEELQEVDGKVRQQIEELAQRASTELGYSLLKNVIARAEYAKEKPLGRVLNQLDIRPFTPESVERYKARHSRAFSLAENKTNAVLYAVGFGLIGGLVSLICVSSFMPPSLRAFACILTATAIVASFGALVGGTRRLVWRATSLRQYPKPVPEFVLNKALQIKAAFPDAQFSVVSRMTREEERVLQDPFLTVYTANEVYYIDVWDEPKFENALFTSPGGGVRV